MEEKIERILKWAKTEKPAPYTIEMNITNRCNLKCKMCWLRNFSSNKKEIEDKTWIRVIKEACKLGIEEFRIPGSGEPFIRKELLLSIIKVIKKNKRKGLLISNGTLIDEKVARTLVKFEWDILTISIDGPDKNTHDFIRGVDGAFEKTLKGIEKINIMKEKYGKDSPRLRMNTVITNKNVEVLEKMIELGSSLGFSEVLFQPITIFSDEGKKLLPKENLVKRNLRKALLKANNLNIFTNAKILLKKQSIKAKDLQKLWKKIFKTNKDFLKIPCYEPFYNIVINPYGEVGPCAVFGSSELNVKVMKLKEIWYKEFEKYRNSLKKGEMFKFCKNCCVPIFLENERIRGILRSEIYGR